MALSWSAAYAASRDSAHFRFTSASASRSLARRPHLRRGGRGGEPQVRLLQRRARAHGLTVPRLQLLHRGAARAARPGPQRALCLEAALAPARRTRSSAESRAPSPGSHESARPWSAPGTRAPSRRCNSSAALGACAAAGRVGTGARISTASFASFARRASLFLFIPERRTAPRSSGGASSSVPVSSSSLELRPSSALARASSNARLIFPRSFSRVVSDDASWSFAPSFRKRRRHGLSRFVDFHASRPTTPSIADFAEDLASSLLSLRFFESFAIVPRREPGANPVRHRAHRSAQTRARISF